MHFLISILRLSRCPGSAEVSTMTVVTLDGVPSVGGSVICGNNGCILWVTKTSFTSEVMRLDLPVESSPTTQMRTVCVMLRQSDLSRKEVVASLSKCSL